MTAEEPADEQPKQTDDTVNPEGADAETALVAQAGLFYVSGLDDRTPVWKLTDWTAWQRNRAVAGQLLIAIACGLLAWSLAHWWSTPLAATTGGPIAVTLLCLGIALLQAAYWYRYLLATNCVGQRVVQMEALVNLMGLAALVALLTLGLQVVGAALVTWIGFPLWQAVGPYVYAIPMTVGVVAFFGSLFVASGATWRPTRAPTMSDDAFVSRAPGWFLVVRWLMQVVMIRAGFIFVLIPSYIVFLGYVTINTLPHSFPVPIAPAIRDLAVLAVVFLIATLSELALWIAPRSAQDVR